MLSIHNCLDRPVLQREEDGVGPCMCLNQLTNPQDAHSHGPVYFVFGNIVSAVDCSKGSIWLQARIL